MSHLQSLKEEEERLADEEDNTVMLTYDRPEVANKVILRKKSAVDGWEVVHNKSYPLTGDHDNNTTNSRSLNYNTINSHHQSHDKPSSCAHDAPISTAENCDHQKLPSRITKTLTVNISPYNNNSSNSPRRSSRRLTSS